MSYLIKKSLSVLFDGSDMTICNMGVFFGALQHFWPDVLAGATNDYRSQWQITWSHLHNHRQSHKSPAIKKN